MLTPTRATWKRVPDQPNETRGNFEQVTKHVCNSQVTSNQLNFAANTFMPAIRAA
jgi:hypothetical protein